MSTVLAPDHIDFVCSLVRQKAAIELESSKAYLIDARLAPVAKRQGFQSTSDMIEKLRSQPGNELQAMVVEAMTTNETSFFRDKHPFDALENVIIPEMMKNRSDTKKLNIWSAACSSGQEIYSIGMTIFERFPELKQWNLKFFGTDLSDEVLNKAKAARYSQVEVNRGLPAMMLLKYFDRDGIAWKLKDEIRNCSTFSKLNLNEPLPSMEQRDIVFLRNVMIYFSTEVKKAILHRVRQVMPDDGILVLGAAETTIGMEVPFKRYQIGQAVFYRAT